MMSDKKLTGEIAVVTGADSGIGQATAIAVAREGADVAITYLDDQQGAQHTQKLVEQAGQKAFVTQLDQSNPEAARTRRLDLNRLHPDYASEARGLGGALAV